MKKRFLSTFATILTLALAGAVAISLAAQTTEEGPGPSEQPSAPMETGQGRPAPPPQGNRPPYGQAPDEQPGGPSGEAPAETKQGVGRVSMIHGDVSTQRGDSGTWSAAVLNQPVLSGDKVSTGARARAEVQLDFANILRLSSNAQANIADFTQDHIQIQLGHGLANYSVFNESEAEPEIDTPNVAVHPAHKDVILRIEVRSDGDTVVIVRKGEAEISTPKGIAELKQGEMATVRGPIDTAQYKVTPAPDRDDWDRWNIDRDHMIHSAQSWKHTNRYYTGAEDLDANGTWENAPDYGEVWVPNEAEDWAPYRDGNWVWEPYYGWTWVGYESWGWAPYHYGRWMWYGGSWAWWPGPVWGAPFYRPFWAPAYVSFFGFGFGWGGWGGFGWLPIGPCDRFFPWWGGYGGRFGVVGFNRFGTLNRFGGIAPLHGGTRFSNVAHINDAHIGRALSTVGAGHFGTGRTRAAAASHTQLSGARMMTGNLPVVPTRASLSASGRAAAPSTIHNNANQRFAGTQPGSRPQSFQQQASHLQQSMQENHVAGVTAGGRATGAGASNGRPGAGALSSARELNNPGRTGGNQAASENTRSLSTPSNGNTRSESGANSIGESANRTQQSTAAHGEPNSSEWKSFTPSAQSGESASRGGKSPASAGGSGSGSYWNRTAPSPSYSRGSSSSSRSYARGGSGYSRPQLNMRQPIVQPRSSGGYGGGSRAAPSYGGGHSSGGQPSGGHSSGGSGGHSNGGGHR